MGCHRRLDPDRGTGCHNRLGQTRGLDQDEKSDTSLLFLRVRVLKFLDHFIKRPNRTATSYFLWTLNNDISLILKGGGHSLAGQHAFLTQGKE